MSTPALLSNLMVTTAKVHASRLGYSFTSSCEYDLQKLALAAAIKMDIAGDINEPAKIDLATKNIKRLVDEMIKYAKSRSSTELEESSLRSVISWICPLYSFC